MDHNDSAPRSFPIAKGESLPIPGAGKSIRQRAADKTATLPNLNATRPHPRLFIECSCSIPQMHADAAEPHENGPKQRKLAQYQRGVP